MWSRPKVAYWRVSDPGGASQGGLAARDNANLFLGHF